MIKAVIFDMYETLITHYKSPLYFGKQMAADAGIPESNFQELWRGTEEERTKGKLTFEDIIEMILVKNNCYSVELQDTIIRKRIKAKEECFEHLHPEILPLLESIKEKGIMTGLISNCFSEESGVIRKSVLFPYFDAVCLSCEMGISKPDFKIYESCMNQLKVKADECLYVGDGGSHELEAAKELGMNAVQAVWYLLEGTSPQAERKENIKQVENPLDVLKILEK